MVRMHAMHPSIHVPTYALRISDLAHKLDDEGGAPRQSLEGRALAAPERGNRMESGARAEAMG